MPTKHSDLRPRLAAFVRSLTWHRRLLAAGLAAGALALAIEAASPAPPATTPVTVAAKDLRGGAVVNGSDVTTAKLPPDAVPDRALTRSDVIGRTLAGPMTKGEVLTDVRVVGESMTAGWGSAMTAVPVRLADAGAAALLSPGDRIDVVAAGVDGAGGVDVVAYGVPVLTVTKSKQLSGGGLVMVAASADQATSIAGAAVASQLTYRITPD